MTKSDVVGTLIAQVQAQLARGLEPQQPVCLACSGGVDSTVLLHALAQIGGRPLRAVYIDHGLQPESARWGDHVRELCRDWNVECAVITVDVDAAAGQGAEAVARDARYAALQQQLGSEEALLTAHHELDQLETYLLQLFRGAGVHGLAAMPARTHRRGYLHLRPLLSVPAAQVRAYAQAAGLRWIEDPSNASHAYDRNFLRHEIVPLLLERWPGAAQSVARSARLTAEAAAMLDELAGLDSADATEYRRLPLATLTALSPARRKNLLRYLLRSWRLPVPSAVQLDEALRSLMDAADDRQPLAAWPGARVRRYRDTLWFFSESGDPGKASDAPELLDWDTSGPLEMGEVRGRLELRDVTGRGIALRCLSRPVSVRFRQGGERLRPVAGGRTRELKKLLQETDIVPWMRNHIPLVYAGDDLLAVGDLWVDVESCAEPGEEGRALVWTGHAPVS
jgi:tRNA(Ile)-lysidine synthase